MKVDSEFEDLLANAGTARALLKRAFRDIDRASSLLKLGAMNVMTRQSENTTSPMQQLISGVVAEIALLDRSKTLLGSILAARTLKASTIEQAVRDDEKLEGASSEASRKIKKRFN